MVSGSVTCGLDSSRTLLCSLHSVIKIWDPRMLCSLRSVWLVARLHCTSTVLVAVVINSNGNGNGN